jgi:hypothetical protein
MKYRIVVGCILAGLMPLAVGCTHYYRVNDPAGNKDYYTTKVDQTKSGSIKLKDARTGATVTLQSSEVKEISEDEYEAALKAPKVVPAPAPAPSATPAP